MPTNPFSVEALKRIAIEQTQEPAIDPVTDEADEPKYEKWPYFVMGAGQGADATTTIVGARRNNVRELNPLGFKGVLGVKAAAVPLSMWLMYRLQQKGHPKHARAIGVLSGLAGAIPAAWNLRQLYKARGQ